jgi:leucine-rich repeat protein SHOC2
LKNSDSCAHFCNKIARLQLAVILLCTVNSFSQYNTDFSAHFYWYNNNFSCLDTAIKYKDVCYNLFINDSSITEIDERIGELTKLRKLYILCPQLKKLPEGIQKFKCLSHLTIKISNPEFTEIPIEIAEIRSLESLTIEGRYIHKIKTNEKPFKKLKHLTILNTNLQALPENLGKIIQLREIIIDNDSALSSIPSAIGKLPILKNIELSNIPLLHNLPDEFGKLQSLLYLKIINCSSFTTLSKSFAELQSLYQLELSGLNEMKNLPDDFSKLRSLQVLGITNCTKLNALPKSFGSLPLLTYLHLSNLAGITELPESFGKLQQLESLTIQHCQNFKLLSESFYKLPELRFLVLADLPQLDSFPAGFGNLKNLKQLHITNCAFEQLPLELANLQKIYFIKLDSLPITRFPSSLISYSLARLQINHTRLKVFEGGFNETNNLQHLDLCSNQIDSISPDIKKLKLLKVALLTDNKLTSLPKELGSIPQLHQLYIDKNAFTNLSGSINGLTQLKDLDISYNSTLNKLTMTDLMPLTKLKKITVDSKHASSFVHQSIRPGQIRHLDFVNGDITDKQRNELSKIYFKVHSISNGDIFEGYTYRVEGWYEEPGVVNTTPFIAGCGKGHWSGKRVKFDRSKTPIYRRCVTK